MKQNLKDRKNNQSPKTSNLKLPAKLLSQNLLKTQVGSMHVCVSAPHSRQIPANPCLEVLKNIDWSARVEYGNVFDRCVEHEAYLRILWACFSCYVRLRKHRVETKR